MIKWESYEDAKQRMETEKAKETVKVLKPKQIRRQLKKGKLTEEQAIERIQKYMDSLEYNEAIQPREGYDTVCGGIRPVILPED